MPIQTAIPLTAKRIVAYFGLDTLEIVETQSGRSIEVTGIGTSCYWVPDFNCFARADSICLN